MKFKNRFWLVMVLLAGVSLLNYCQGGKNYQLVDMNGKSYNFKDFRGKVVVVHFWTPHLEPSLTDVPVLDELYGAYDEKQLEIIGVVVENNPVDIADIIRDRGMDWIQINDVKYGKQLYDDCHVSMYPAIAVYDQQGCLVNERISAIRLKEQVKRLVKGEKPLTNSSFPMPEMNGNTITLDQFKGKVLVLHFWSARCSLCTNNLPKLIDLYNSFDENQLEMISFSLIDDVGTAESYIRSNGMEWQHVVDSSVSSGLLLQDYQVSGKIPLFVCLDKNGKVAYQGNFSGLEKKIPALVK